jgi:hypothetical protein
MAARDDLQSTRAAFCRRAGSARVATAVVAVPLLLFGAGLAPAYADPMMPTPTPSPGFDPGVEQIDDLLESSGGGARGGIQLPGIQVFGPQFPVPPVEAFPGTIGIPVPGICVPGMPCPVIPLPQQDLPEIDAVSPGGAPQH